MTSLLPSTQITAPVSPALTGTVLQVRDRKDTTRNLCVQAKFTYDGTTGTTVDVYVQTSLDEGTTWTDIANFHFTTASARKIVNLSGVTPVTTAISGTDGALAANTVQDGVLGNQFRAKYASTGTYSGTTLLQVDVFGPQLVPLR